MIDAVLKAGKTPILPTIPYASDPDAGKYTAEYNAKVAQLYSEYGDKLLHGPDFYAFFQANSDLLGDDGVHPSSDGYEAMRKLWAETMYEAVYQNAASVPEEPVTVDPIRGDVNSDGVFDVTDVVLLQKWLLSVPDTHLADWKNGDFYEDDSLDVFDLALMKRSLVGDPVQETPHTQDFTALYEAEDGTCSGENSVMDDAAASGGKVVGNFADDADTLTFTVNIPSDGCYNLHFTAKGLGGEKSNNVSVDGENVGSFTSAADTYTSGTVRNVLMTAGTHKITIQKSWGWITVDSLEIKADEMISDSIYNVSDQLINPNADANTKALFSYLCDSYGKYTLSGQVCDYGLNGPEYQAIFEVTGKYPAICGLDFMNYATALSDRGIRGESVDTALQIHQAGGIVEFCWHWSAPAKYVKDGNDANGNPCWWQGFSTTNVTIDLDAVMNGRDPEGLALLDADIAAIAKQIKTLEDAGVPILWRPLHEASGGWFWWGASGADAYKKLWYHLYDQLTNVYGCNNLIWVWNGQSAEWYPGDDYVDIVGEDIYAGERNYAPQNAKFSEIAEITGGRKIIALTENGTLPDIDKMVAANARWAWFGTWCGDFVLKNGVYSEQFTDREMLKKVYGSEYVITLDELPWNQ